MVFNRSTFSHLLRLVPSSRRASFPCGSMIAVQRLWAISFVPGPVKEPERGGDLRQFLVRATAKVQSGGAAPRICACFASTSGVSCSGSNDSEIRRIRLARSGNRTDALGQLAELSIHQRAEIGKWTSRINKRKYNDIPAQVRELERLSFLGRHREVGHGIAHLEQLRLLRAGLPFPWKRRGPSAAPPAW